MPEKHLKNQVADKKIAARVRSSYQSVNSAYNIG